MTEPERFPIRDRYLDVLVAVEQCIATCHDIRSCYDKILERIGQATHASRSFILEPKISETKISGTRETKSGKEYDPSAQFWHFPVAEWRAETSSPLPGTKWQPLLNEATISSWIAALYQGSAVIKTLSDRTGAEHQGLMSDGLGAPGFAIIMLPLMMQGNLYGAIGLEQWDDAQIWNASEIQMLQGVAVALSFKLEQHHYQLQIDALSQQVQQLGNNLENIAQRHTSQLQKALDFEALLKRMTDRVRDSLDERQILQTAVQELATGLNTYSCDAALYDLEQGTSTIAYEYINCEMISSARGVSFQFADFPEFYSYLLQGQYLQFCWRFTVSVLAREDDGQFAILCCPIIDDQGVIGDIWLYNQADACFEIEEVRLVEQVANQCAIALRQAQLYQAAQAQVQQLEQLNYLKDDFLNTVSHELRSPMANIEMATQMLELLLFKDLPLTAVTSEAVTSETDKQHSHHNGKLPSDIIPSALCPLPSAFQQAFRYFRMLQDECLRETNLINDLLDLSRLEAGTEPIVLTTIHLQTWIPHVIEPFLEQACTQNQQLQIEISPNLPPLSTDLSSLERIVSELLHNACKYTPVGEAIQVSALLQSSGNGSEASSQFTGLPPKLDPLTPPAKCKTQTRLFLLLRVSNSGVEIPPPELPRIFDKFYRIPSNDPWKHGGTGLGLALVKRLVEHLGATIGVESDQNQVTFTVAFPMDLLE